MSFLTAWRRCATPNSSLWALDHKINSRGFLHRSRIRGSRAQDRASNGPEINGEIAAVTNNEVDSINMVAEAPWVAAWARLRDALARTRRRRGAAREGDFSAPVRRAARSLRLSGAQAASKKIVSLLDRAGDDDRV